MDSKIVSRMGIGYIHAILRHCYAILKTLTLFVQGKRRTKEVKETHIYAYLVNLVMKNVSSLSKILQNSTN